MKFLEDSNWIWHPGWKDEDKKVPRLVLFRKKVTLRDDPEKAELVIPAETEKIVEISERTLRRCMHETYEDCPYYEQLQYIMDSRTQILYTYSVSADDRLARKCMDDLTRSQRYDGLLNCSYPNCNPNIIPGFSIYYILMLYDHMMYFGDKKLTEKYMPTVERILQFFEDHLTEEGYVGKTGSLIMEEAFWSFSDWAEEWNPTSGMPPAGLQGPITMESLLYIYGLQHGAKLAEYLGRKNPAEQAKGNLLKTIQKKKSMHSVQLP